jgi:hypothetical protein
VNGAQRLWWQQAQSDLALYEQLRRIGVHECHLLHYLQMATEKLSKAYFWRKGNPPPKSHTGFFRFLKALTTGRRTADLKRIAKLFGFARLEDFENWVSTVQPLVYGLQNIAPAEAGNGPNPEYPWPHEAPRHYPAGHSFDLWKQLVNTGQGRKLLEIVARAIAKFDVYG